MSEGEGQSMNYLSPLIADLAALSESVRQVELQRKECHGFIDYDDLQRLPWLPNRIEISELNLKAHGMISLRHATHEHRTPWVRKGWYKLIAQDGRLYVIEISSTVACGNQPCAWIYRPKVRIKMGADNN
jgi:hypothetical protein